MADPRILREIRSHAEETTVLCWSAGFSSTDAAARWAAEHGGRLLEALKLCREKLSGFQTDAADKMAAEAIDAAEATRAVQSPKGGGCK